MASISGFSISFLMMRIAYSVPHFCPQSSELFLSEYNIYRSDRAIVSGKNCHGGSLIAVKNSLITEDLSTKHDIPDSCVLCSIKLHQTEMIIGSFYNPPKNSNYRYKVHEFEQLIKAIPKNKPFLLCGDLNFPETNWNTLTSTDEEENQILQIFENGLFRQAIDFPTCVKNILDVAFYRNCYTSAEQDFNVSKIYDCSDHNAIMLSIECTVSEPKPYLENFRSFGNADFEGINNFINENPFEPVCHTNINKMHEEYTQYLDEIIKSFVPLRTRHRQSLPPWITSSTSNLIKKLQTKRQSCILKPTNYRRQQVKLFENLVTESSEVDRKNYQEELFRTRNTNVIFKHLKNLNKHTSLPKLLIKDEVESTNPNEQVNMLNDFFHSVFNPKESFSIRDIQFGNPLLTNFDISKKTVSEILSTLDVTKSRGPNGLPPSFFQKTNRNICKPMNKILRNVKRLRKIPDSWKTAAVTPVHKKGDRKLVNNYRPVSLLNIDSKVLEKCIYKDLYPYFAWYLTKHQHGFTKGRSVLTNMLSFLKEIYEALDNDSNAEIVAVYTDFAKAFDKVPHFDLLKKVALIGIGGCMLEVLYDYLKNRKQFVRVDNISSKVLEVTSGVPQGSLLGPLLFCIFINDLPEVLKFSEPYIFADDLKLLSIKKTSIEIQEDLDKIQQWVTENKMELALDKCAKVSFRGGDANSMLFGVVLGTSMVVKDLGIFVSGDLSWKVHIETRLKKANQVLYLLRRNLSAKINTFVKLGLYKSLILPVLLYGLSYIEGGSIAVGAISKESNPVDHWK